MMVVLFSTGANEMISRAFRRMSPGLFYLLCAPAAAALSPATRGAGSGGGGSGGGSGDGAPFVERPLAVAPATGKGLGAFAAAALPEGARVCSYHGERLSLAQVAPGPQRRGPHPPRTSRTPQPSR